MNIESADIKLDIIFVNSLCILDNIWLVKMSEGGWVRERRREGVQNGEQKREEGRKRGGEVRREGREVEKREAKKKRKREERPKRG